MKVNSLSSLKAMASLCFLVILSCQPSNVNNSNISTTLLSDLKDYKTKNEFLEKIYASDQNIRKNASLFNQGTEEHHKFWLEARNIDSLNLIKIDLYLKKFGYPDTLHFTDNAKSAPWYVIQHCTDLRERTKYYKTIRQAYVTGKVSEIQFFLYLARNFSMKHKEMMGIENDDAYSFEEKISIFLDTLGYEQINRS